MSEDKANLEGAINQFKHTMEDLKEKDMEDYAADQYVKRRKRQKNNPFEDKKGK